MGGELNEEAIGYLLSFAKMNQHDGNPSPLEPISFDTPGIALYRLGVAKNSSDANFLSLVSDVSAAFKKNNADPQLVTMENIRMVGTLAQDLSALSGRLFWDRSAFVGSGTSS